MDWSSSDVSDSVIYQMDKGELIGRRVMLVIPRSARWILVN